MKFAVRPISEASPGISAVLIRHDIDVSLEQAQPIAEIEASLGLRATYAIMTSTPLYDIREPRNRQLMHRLTSLGHEIGLHFDAHDDQLGTEEDVMAACETLEAACDAPVLAVSFHRPQPRFLRGPWHVANRVNAYSQQLMENYISDSAGTWREGEPIKRLRGHSDWTPADTCTSNLVGSPP